MENIFINAGIIAIIYLLIKFAEMRMVIKEARPIKELVRDMIIVYISVLLGMYIIDELVQSSSKNVKFESTKAFTDAPGF